MKKIPFTIIKNPTNYTLESYYHDRSYSFFQGNPNIRGLITISVVIYEHYYIYVVHLFIQ